MMEKFDSIIIGSGQAGNPLALAMAAAGQNVAIIERAFVGGTCINYGCTPTKTLVASAAAANLTNRASDYGIRIVDSSVDMSAVRARKQTMVESWRESSESALTTADHVTLIHGDARFVGEREISVLTGGGGDRRLTADTIVINTGGKPTIPNIEGLKSVPYYDSTSIMELDFVPEHLIILGGGYIACEFGQMYRRFGSRVTIVQRAAQLFGREDDDVADEVKSILESDGIDIRLNAQTSSFTWKQDSGAVVCNIDGEECVTGSHLLVAIGRTPCTAELNLPLAGVEVDKSGYIKVDEHLETSAKNVFAVGDVKGGPAFTHISYDDFRILKRRLIDADEKASITGRLVPYTVFIDPQLGRIGLSENDAKQINKSYRLAKMPMSHVARAVETGNDRGFMKALVDVESGVILGAAILGMEGGELMAMLQIAIMGKLPYTALRDGIFAHPTLAESFNNLFSTLK